MAGMANAARIFHLGYGKDLVGMARAVQAFFSEEWRLETQALALDGSEWLVQGRPEGHALRRLFGFEHAATVRLEELGAGRVAVEIGGAGWLDVAGPPPDAMVVLRPLEGDASLGIRRRGLLADGVMSVVERYLGGSLL